MGIFDTPAPVSGQATLVAGTVAVTIPGLKTTSFAVVAPKTPGGTMGTTYQAVCTANTLTITSLSGGATQTLDTSVVQYIATY